jgi:hypothetical protein
VVWASYGQDGDSGGVLGQRYDSAGAPLGNEFQVNTHTTSRQDSPSIATDSSGRFVVAWTSYFQDGDGAGVFGQRFAASPDTDEDGVPDSNDNCRLEPNPDQADVDAGQDDDSSQAGVQHYGDRCDGDLNNDGIVNTTDFFGFFRPCFGASVDAAPECGAADMDGNGTVNTGDFFGFFRPQVGGPPGPGYTEP